MLRGHSSPSETEWPGLGESSKEGKGGEMNSEDAEEIMSTVVVGAEEVDRQVTPRILACVANAAATPR